MGVVNSPQVSQAQCNNQELSGDESDHNRRRANVVLNGAFCEFPPKEESKGHISTLDGAFSIGVVVLPQLLLLVDFLAICDYNLSR